MRGVDVSIFSWQHIVILLVAASLLFAFACLGKKVGRKDANDLIMALLWANFSLHFLKQIMYVFLWPGALSTSTIENLCAFWTVAAPFLYKFGKGFGRDYIALMGYLGGIFALLIPSGCLVVSEHLASLPYEDAFYEVYAVLECCRYVFCHLVLILVPTLMISSGIYRPSYKRSPLIVPMVSGAMLIIAINTVLVSLIGLYEYEEFYEVFGRDYYGNPGFAFGIPSNYDNVLGWVKYLNPPFMYFTLPNGETAWMPALWLIIPGYLVCYPLYLLAIAPFEWKHFKADFLAFRERRKLRKGERK